MHSKMGRKEGQWGRRSLQHSHSCLGEERYLGQLLIVFKGDNFPDGSKRPIMDLKMSFYKSQYNCFPKTFQNFTETSS